MSESSDYWRKCSTCKKPIAYGALYFVCSVSTCNRKRSAMAFCDIRCWDAHVPIMNHREASAEEKRAPAKGHTTELRSSGAKGSNKEILVVASRVKAYIKEKSGMNTADSALEALSDHLRTFADMGIANAKRVNRQTVMDRDIKKPSFKKNPGVVIRRRKAKE